MLMYIGILHVLLLLRNLLQYYIGVSQNYYSDGIPILVIVQRTVLNYVHVHWDFTCFAATTHFVANYVEFCKKNAILRGLPDLLQYYITGGGCVCRNLQIVLRNI